MTWIAAALIVVALMCFFLPNIFAIVPVVVLATLIMAIVEYRQLSKRFRHIQIARSIPSVVGRDIPFQVELQMTSQNRISIHGELRDEIPALAFPGYRKFEITLPPNGESFTLRSELRLPIRGRFEFGPVWLRLKGIWGLLEAQQSLDCGGSIKVLPETFSSEQSLLKDHLAEIALLEKLTKARQHGVGTEFESLMEFRDGDDPRRIDWRTSARYRRPIVRRYQIERHRDVMIVFDCGRLMGTETDRGTKLDCAIDAGLMLARVALESGDRCGIGLFDDRVLGYLPPVSGVNSLSTIIESVYSAESQWRESDFSQMYSVLQSRQSKRSLIVVISDILDSETTKRFRLSLSKLASRHVVLFSVLQTPLLQQIANSPVESILEGSKKAVAFRILGDRERAIHSLRHSGVHVVDVVPDRLTVPLINQFIELRHRNLL